MNNRRRFITLVPFAGAALLVACSKEAATPTAIPAPAPMPTPPPAPAMPAPATAPATTSTSTGSAAAGATTLPLLQESEPLAAGLGYVAVASRADTTRFKNYVEGQLCGNCLQFVGKAGDTQAPCTLFPGKQVLAAGWCSAYVKKAG